MTSKNAEMQAIFSKLSERNKDMIMLVAQSVKVAQDVAEQPFKPTKNGAEQYVSAHTHA